jgi:hypothetical protein
VPGAGAPGYPPATPRGIPQTDLPSAPASAAANAAIQETSGPKHLAGQIATPSTRSAPETSPKFFAKSDLD